MRFTLCLSVVLVFACAFDLKGQRDFRLIDSLKAVLPTQTGNEAFETLDKLTYELTDFRNEEALKYARPLYQLSFALKDSLKIVRAGVRFGSVLRRLEKADSAIAIYNYILPIARRNQFVEYLKYITNGLGLIYVFKARYDMALSFYLESLALRRKSGSPNEVNIILHNIGGVYYKMKSYEKALSFYEESLRIKREIEDYYDYDNALVNSGLCHVYLKHYSEAIRIFRVGLTYFGDSTQSYVKVNGYFGLGVAYHGLRDLEKSQSFFKKSYEFSKESGDSRLQADNLVYLGRIAFAIGEKQTGINQLLNAEEISLTHEYNELLISVYEELIRMYRTMEKLDQLTIYQAKYIKLKNKVYSAELIENLADLETKLKAQENANVISHQQETLKAASQLIDRNRILIISAIGITFLLGFLLYIMYRNIQLRKSMNHKLEEEVTLRTRELAEVLDHLQELNFKQNATLQHTHEVILSHTQTLQGLEQIINNEKGVSWKRQMEIALRKLNLIAQSDLLDNGLKPKPKV